MGTRASRSTSFLTGLFTLMLVVTVAAGVVIIGGALIGTWWGNDEVSVHTLVDGEQVEGLPEGAVVPDDIEVAVRVTGATDEQLRWFAARDLPYGIVVVAGLWLLRGLLVSVRNGDPFTDRNVRRLRALGLLVLAGVPAAIFLSSLLAQQLAAATDVAEMPTRLEMPGLALLGGLGTFVLSEVFAEGVRMRDDLEGTI